MLRKIRIIHDKYITREPKQQTNRFNNENEKIAGQLHRFSVQIQLMPVLLSFRFHLRILLFQKTVYLFHL